MYWSDCIIISDLTEEERRELEKKYQELNGNDSHLREWSKELIPKAILIFPSIAFAFMFLKINTDKSIIDILGFLAEGCY